MHYGRPSYLLINILKNMKLRSKLTLSYLLACVIPLLIATFIIYNFSANNLEDASLEFASIFNSQIVTTIDDFIDQYDKITKSLLVDNDIINRLSNEDKYSMNELINNQLIFQKLLMRLETLKPDIKSIVLLSSKNNLYQYGRTNNTINGNKLQEQEWLKQMLESDDKLVITSVHDRSYCENQNEEMVITVGRVILNSKGEYSGLLLIDLDPSSLITLNENFLLARNNYNIKITVTTDKGGVLYDSDIASGRNTWVQTLNKGYKGLENKDKSDFILLSSKTHRGNMEVNAEIPRSKLLFKIGRIKYVTFVAILLCILFITAISIIISYSITRPIKGLQKSMKLAETGQYAPIERNAANDEIGELIFSYNNMITKIRELIEDVYIAQIKQKNAKFLALQTQINPHMLYNTLESIRMKALVKDDEEVAAMIKILSRMFRLVLRKDKDQHLIKDELEYASNYIQLQNIRFNNSFSMEEKLSEEIKNSEIIPLVFQPIIENSIKHGFQGYGANLKIVIDGEITDNNDILIKVSDDGIGMVEEKVNAINKGLIEADSDKLKLNDGNTEESIGLKNIAERIKLHYGDNYYMRIKSENTVGTVIEFLIPRQ